MVIFCSYVSRVSQRFTSTNFLIPRQSVKRLRVKDRVINVIVFATSLKHLDQYLCTGVGLDLADVTIWNITGTDGNIFETIFCNASFSIGIEYLKNFSMLESWHAPLNYELSDGDRQRNVWLAVYIERNQWVFFNFLSVCQSLKIKQAEKLYRFDNNVCQPSFSAILVFDLLLEPTSTLIKRNDFPTTFAVNYYSDTLKKDLCISHHFFPNAEKKWVLSAIFEKATNVEEKYSWSTFNPVDNLILWQIALNHLQFLFRIVS